MDIKKNNIITTVIARKMIIVLHVACIREMKNAYKIITTGSDREV
jgi:hypothetical protein